VLTVTETHKYVVFQNAQCRSLTAAGKHIYHKGMSQFRNVPSCRTHCNRPYRCYISYIKLSFCALTPIHRSIQKPVQLLRCANSPHDCSHSAVRNCPRDQLPPTEWVLQFRDSNIIVTSTKMQRKYQVRFLSMLMCSVTSLPPPPPNKRKSSFACTPFFSELSLLENRSSIIEISSTTQSVCDVEQTRNVLTRPFLTFITSDLTKDRLHLILRRLMSYIYIRSTHS